MKILDEKLLNSEKYKSDIKAILNEADYMLDGKYVFNNVWDMEACDIIVSNPQLNWSMQYDNDPEWSYMFVRFDYSYKLLVAYELTNDIKYVKFGLRFINEWYKNNKRFLPFFTGKISNKVNKGRNLSHRTLDLAILASNITDFIIYCKENNLIETKQYWYNRKIVDEICSYISYYDSQFKRTTNWGIMEVAYSLYAIYRLELNFSLDQYIKKLDSQLGAQLYEDGSHVESSPMYLVEVLLAALICLRYIDRKAGLDSIYDKAKNGCKYIYSITSPDGCIPNIGDSDKINVSDLMIIASNIFNDKSFLSKCSRDIKLEFIYKYKMMPLYHIKTNIKNEDFQLQLLKHQCVVADKKIWMLCNNIPYGPSGHKHYDFMTVLMYINGKEFLIDGGRETYKNVEARRINKDAISHSTIRVNGEQYWKYINSWIIERDIEVRDNVLLLDNGSIYVVKMECIFGGNITLTRNVVYVPEVGVFIVDITYGGSLELYEAYFPLDASVQVKQQKNDYILSTDSYSMYYSSSCIGDIEINNLRCSRRYNSYFDTKGLHFTTNSRIAYHCFLFSQNDVTITVGDMINIIVDNSSSCYSILFPTNDEGSIKFGDLK